MEWALALLFFAHFSLAQVGEPPEFQVTRLDTKEQSSLESLFDIFDDNFVDADWADWVDSRHPWNLPSGDDAKGELPAQISFTQYDSDRKKVLEESTLLPNANLSILLRCEGTAPVEWVHDDDRSPGSPAKRSEFTTRRRCPGGGGGRANETIWQFLAELYLFYEQVELTTPFLCRSVTNHSNNIELELTPILDVNRTALVSMTSERGASLATPSPSDAGGDRCPAHLVVVHTTAGFYWRCTLESGEPSKVNIHVCDTAPYCANTFRRSRIPPQCVLFDQSVRLAEVSKSRHWWPMLGNVRAGVAVCGGSRAAAVEFFVYQNGSQKEVSIGFHLTPELVREGLIWLDPPPAAGGVYYTREVFTTRCHVSKYGFAGYGRLHVTLDGNQSLEIDGSIRGSPSGAPNLNSFTSKPVTLRFQEHGATHVLISCAAPLWNTTEVITRTWAFEFRDEVPPFFEFPHQNLTFTDGDVDRTLLCDAQGDPPIDAHARVTWEHRNPPGVRVRGRELILGRVYAEWSDGETVSCTVVNKFGDSATKTFTLRVEPRRAGPEEGGGTGISTGALIVGGVCLAATLLGGLILFVYCRFVRVRGNEANILSQQELKDFREGATSKTLTEGGALIDASARTVPYDQKYEIPRENLYVDFGAKLGSGHYGVVFKGYFKRVRPNSNATPEQVHVAVKVVPAHVPVEYFKALLSELKILVHIGQHERVANLLGACTADIHKGELYVCVELCKTSLLHWLHTAPSTLRRYVQAEFAGAGLLDPCAHKYANEDMSLEDLFRWTAQIASGMEFLSEKRIVHADLAARNVLLTFKHSAKICDFGLARQLVGYKYIQTSSAALPWQWMAIETLRQREFTVKSDVWSFGVTCWEVFTLGDVPYPCTAFTFDFVDQLQGGRRLPKPKHATNATYGLMLECWNPKKEDRPTFGSLAAFLEAQAKKEDKRASLIPGVVYVNTQL